MAGAPATGRRTGAELFFGGIALALLSVICFQVGAGVAPTAFVYLAVIVLVSLRGNLISAVILSIAAVICLAFFVAFPVFNFENYVPEDIIVISVFLLTSLIVTRLVNNIKKRSDALLESEEHWKEVFEQNPNMYFMVDATGKVLSVNSFGAIQLGCAAGDLVGQPVLDVFCGDDREFVQKNLDICLENLGQTRSWEARKMRKDGTLIWVRENAKAVRWAKDEPIFLVSCENITERKHAEEKLQQSEAFLSEAQRLSHTGSFAWHVPTGDISWSDEMFRIYELDPSIKPTLELILQRTHPDDRARLQERFVGRREISIGEDEVRLLMPDGRVKHVRALRGTAEPEYARTLTLVGSVIDITERKQAEEALRQAQADLARVARVTTMGELTANLAHEVSQPITAAVTNANACLRWLAADTPNLDEARAAAGRIVNDGTRAAEIISRTRQLFEKGALDREPVDIDDVIRETITLLNGEAARNAVSVRQLLAAGYPEVMGDRIQLQQVVMNLIMNSIDALKDVEDARELLIKSQRTGDDEVLVSISDSGIGLPPERAEQLFETFFTTKPHGTGMGLSISRSIVEAHGGRLWAEPNTPRGAVFRFTLPTEVASPPA
ncbi:MAG TPA: PAS domain S-box protein [Phenylobacterium sp.]|jgi:PAS domain S-box-containing protein|uniref:PAS domain S-box protein n=1 Tax=Phenylobacterium sp. TaxID=1871053 RepID=UPI002C035435|nr:PAS domain S-box protein [Phenylobacterium sp.]HXA37940.1 PAS domain S-box protein [Phenylobacterium sp.]